MLEARMSGVGVRVPAQTSRPQCQLVLAMPIAPA
jgi:hypothetical protein